MTAGETVEPVGIRHGGRNTQLKLGANAGGPGLTLCRSFFVRLLVPAVALIIVCSAVAADPPITISGKTDQGVLEFRYKGQKLLVYAFATNQFKPYVKELYNLRGENVTRDAPPDHLHHHGLMYAVYVNGINFWEERGAPGVERHVRLANQATASDADGTPVGSFTEHIHWLAPTNLSASESPAAALLVERRTLTVRVDEKNQEVALKWDSNFQVGSNAGKVTLSGPNYDGLGMRLPESFNHVAKFQNSADQAYAGNNSQNVITAKWTSAAGQMEGRPVMVVAFGRSENAKGDGDFFTMLDPFAYISITQGLDKKPLEYSAGDKFSLSYLITVYSEDKSSEFIRQRCNRWEKERK